MPLRFAPVAPVLLGVLFAQVALGVMTPLIPLLLLRAGTATTTIGLVASAYFLGFLAGALTASRIVNRVGHIRAFAVFAALAADAALLMAFHQAAWLWALLRIAIGFTCSGMFLVAESWLNDRSDPTTRGRIFGAYLVVSWGGSAAGPLALNVVAGSSLLFVAVGLAFATSLIPMALTRQPNPQLSQASRLSLRDLYAASPHGMVTCLGSGLCNSAFYSLIPIYLERHGYDAAAVAAFLSAMMVSGLAVQYPVGMLSDRFGRRPVALVSLVAACAMAGLLGLAAHQSLIVLIVIGCLLVGLTAPLYGLGAGQTADRLDRDQFVAASGGLLFTWSVGSSIGPSAAGAVMGLVGSDGLFAYMAVVLAMVALFTANRMRRRAEVPAEKRSVFVPATAAPPRLPDLAHTGRLVRETTIGD